MAQKYDAIIVLGGGRDNEGNLTELSKQRLEAGCRLYHTGTADKIFALGSKYAQFRQSGAELRIAYMLEKNVRPDDIINAEDARGRDTIGEAFASRKAAKKLGFKNLLVVTSDKHMERALFIFRRIFGSSYEIDGSEVPCGDILNAQEEQEFLQATQELFNSLPQDIPAPESWEEWAEEQKSLYEKLKEIHAKYVKGDTETNQAYMGAHFLNKS